MFFQQILLIQKPHDGETDKATPKQEDLLFLTSVQFPPSFSEPSSSTRSPS